MVRKASEMEVEIRPNMKGGKGQVVQHHAFKENEIPAPCRVCATLVLEPGCSIGTHAHEGEDEIFYIVSGTGTVNDNGTLRTVTAGDAVLTGNGAVHGIENTGSDTLTVFAVVVKYAG